MAAPGLPSHAHTSGRVRALPPCRQVRGTPSRLQSLLHRQLAAQGTRAPCSWRHREKCGAGQAPRMLGRCRESTTAPGRRSGLVTLTPLHHHQPLDARRGIFAPCLSQMTPGEQHPPRAGRERLCPTQGPKCSCPEVEAAEHPGVLLAQHWMQPGAPRDAAQRWEQSPTTHSSCA